MSPWAGCVVSLSVQARRESCQARVESESLLGPFRLAVRSRHSLRAVLEGCQVRLLAQGERSASVKTRCWLAG